MSGRSDLNAAPSAVRSVLPDVLLNCTITSTGLSGAMFLRSGEIFAPSVFADIAGNPGVPPDPDWSTPGTWPFASVLLLVNALMLGNVQVSTEDGLVVELEAENGFSAETARWTSAKRPPLFAVAVVL